MVRRPPRAVVATPSGSCVRGPFSAPMVGTTHTIDDWPRQVHSSITGWVTPTRHPLDGTPGSQPVQLIARSWRTGGDALRAGEADPNRDELATLHPLPGPPALTILP